MKVFYSRILQKAIRLNVINLNSKVLVVGGGPNDSETLKYLNFKNVVISNLSPHGNQTDYSPYVWKKLNLNDLTLADNSFDLVIVSAALHHLYSPHRGLCEMLRVSSKAVIFIESSDNFLSRLTRKMNLVPEYEIDAILRDGKGGVENSHIPNHIYRWTRIEVKKTVNSYLPHSKNSFYFFHNYELPIARLRRSNSFFIKLFVTPIRLSKFILTLLFPKQANEFGVLIIKGYQLHPWLEGNLLSPELNLSYIREKYKTNL